MSDTTEFVINDQTLRLIDRWRSEEIVFHLRRERTSAGVRAQLSTHCVRDIIDPFSLLIPPNTEAPLRGIISREYIESAFAHLMEKKGVGTYLRSKLFWFLPKKERDNMIDCVVCGKRHQRVKRGGPEYYPSVGDLMKSRGWSVFIGCGEELFESADRDGLLDGLIRAGIKRNLSVWTFTRGDRREDVIGFHGFGSLLAASVVLIECQPTYGQ